MLTHIKSYKPGIMNKQTYVLETKPISGKRGERTNKCTAHSLSEAINIFAQIKQLRPDQLIELFSVYEQPSNGK